MNEYLKHNLVLHYVETSSDFQDKLNRNETKLL